LIRTIALGVVCLAGLGVIGPAARRSPPQPAEVVFPVAAGDKADRLPINGNPETLTDADTVNVAYVPPAEERPNRCRYQRRGKQLDLLALTSFLGIGTTRMI
jgi:hypothetical protein